MDNAFSRLVKVIGLERKQGYRNKAVIGGLDKFASRWEADARAETADQAAVTEIVALLIGYSAMADTATRERIIEQVLRRLRDISPDGGPGAEQARAFSPATQGRGAAPATVDAPAEGAGKPVARPEPWQRPVENRPGPTRPASSPPARPAPAAPDTGEAANTETRAAAETPRAAEPAPSSGRPAAEASPAAPETDLNLEEWGLPSAPAAATASRRLSRASERSDRPSASRCRPAANQKALPRLCRRSRSHSRRQGGRSASKSIRRRPNRPPRVAPEQPVARETADRASSRQEVRENRADQGDETAVRHDFGGLAEQDDQDHEGYESNEGELTTAPGRAQNRHGRPARSGVEGAPSQSGGRGLEAPVTRLPGVGPSFAEKLAKIGVQTVRDLLYLLPRRYDDFSALRTIDKLRYGEEVTVIGTIWDVKTRTIGENRKITVAVVGDGTGELQVTWFNPFVERQLHIGHAFVFSGTIDNFRGRLVMSNPEFETLDREQVSTGRLVPVYPLTAGLSGRWLRKIMNLAVNQWAAAVPDFLPERIRRSADLLLALGCPGADPLSG